MNESKQNPNIEIGLSVLCAVASAGETLTQKEIADVCGCSRSAIWRLELNAMKKAKQIAERLDLHPFLEA